MNQDTQDLLTRIGPGTGMGALLRRYWHPVAGSAELAPGEARKVRLLGEDLALFRTASGRLGLLEESCPHRRASLAYGEVDGETILCPYHGWTFAADGRCLAMPAESEQKPALLARCRATAYRAEELGGLIFAYLGPEPVPLLPRWDLLVWPDGLRDIGRALIPCNWLQIMENSVDPTHVEWLHGRHLAWVRGRKGLPAPTHYRRHQVRIGFDTFPYGIIKRRVLEGGSEADDDWHIGHPLLFPLMVRVGAGQQHRLQIRVPVDDTHTLHFWYACYRPKPGQPPPAQRRIPVYDIPWQDEHGDFITDFVDGGDIMAWVTQGPIADRTREQLVASDAGIALYRRMLLDEMRRSEAGEDPLGVVRDPESNRIIELPQERNKLGGGKSFLREAVGMSHVRYSPILHEITALLEGA
ncbi:aromatic ring-hydroxylating dioxygenase subunit alpha [uncultured Thiohalocapsa sp.]|uniref:aromatic ring-hydroxylating dioxygenase subunit alpha n=1 Tax=uncultured Thiohalocapsa sp. TaxID=768990 RepID=UPI0025CFFE85|nr:aromatic ring-hydroxylating dioxygenase subunit alpha [uncultured Thiohalocapsa sp.]